MVRESEIRGPQKGTEYLFEALDILIITWNCSADLKRCLESIKKFPPSESYVVTLVDNGSTDDTLEMVRRDFPEVRLILNSVNRGVAPARNQGLAVTQSEFVMLLDADTEILEGSLDVLLSGMRSHPRAGIVGAQLLYSDMTIQPSCKRLPDRIAPVFNRLTRLPGIKQTRSWRNHMMADWDHGRERVVDYVIGANQLIRTAALREIGLLDERIFYGPEDIDFCLRMWLGGWQVWYIPQAKIIHHCARLTKRNPFSRLALLHFKGLAYFFRKHRPEERARIRRLVSVLSGETGL